MQWSFYSLGGVSEKTWIVPEIMIYESLIRLFGRFGTQKQKQLSGHILFEQQADRGFARSRLCTDEDGTTNNLVCTLHGVRNDTSKKGGDAPRATD